MKGKTHQNLKASVEWKSSNGRWSLVEPSKKGKKAKGGRSVKKKRDSGDGEEDSSLYLGPESETGKSCCCVPLFRL
jgi:hypothetical protein